MTCCFSEWWTKLRAHKRQLDGKETRGSADAPMSAYRPEPDIHWNMWLGSRHVERHPSALRVNNYSDIISMFHMDSLYRIMSWRRYILPWINRRFFVPYLGFEFTSW